MANEAHCGFMAATPGTLGASVLVGLALGSGATEDAILTKKQTPFGIRHGHVEVVALFGIRFLT